jgi:ribosome-associated heat shock protein Hsp15
MSGRQHDQHDDDADLPSAPAGAQRLDKWLWFARVIKSRTQAAALVTDGKVRLNKSKVEKPSQAVKPGDVLTVAVHSRVRILEVVAAGSRRGPPAEAQGLFRDLTPPPPPRDAAAALPSHAAREPGTGRPTKRDRRHIQRLKKELE